MTNDKLYKKLAALLDIGEDANEKHIKELRKVLKKLKKNQKELFARLEGADSEHEGRKIKQDIEVLKLQRKKGVKVYKELKQAKSRASGTEDVKETE